MTSSTFQPDWFSRPGDTVADLMVQRSLSAQDLADQLGTTLPTVRDLLCGMAAIDAAFAQGLADTIGGSPEFWIRRQEGYERALSRIASTIPSESAAAWVRGMPLADLASYGWIDRPRRGATDVRTCLAYFGVNGPEDWAERYADFVRNIPLRESKAFETQVGALASWLRRAEIMASTISCKPWDVGVLARQVAHLRELVPNRNPADFIPRLRALCAEAGVALVVLRAPRGCPASGAVRFLSPRKAMLVLSFRHRSDDHLWFTFFHEIAHLLLHSDVGSFVEVDDMAKEGREAEANEFAADILIPARHRGSLETFGVNARQVIRFAVRLGLSAGVVVGQMQKAKLLGPQQLSSLKRRYTWEEVERFATA